MRQVWSEFVIGSKRVGPTRTITADDILIHAKETGDFYPHHMDAEWCATQPFKKRMAHGTLVLSVAVGSLADEINEAAMSYGYDRVRFIAPVYIDDTIQAHSEIVAQREHVKNPEKYGFIDENVVVANQNNETVMAFTHIYLVDKS
jgi:acyl dehydratase